MKIPGLILAALGTWIAWGPAMAQEEPFIYTPVWERIIPELQKISELEELQKDLPKWSILRNNQKKNRSKIEALLDESVEILGLSDARPYRAEIAELETQNQEDEARIAQLREDRIGAPDSAVWQASTEDINRKIGTIERRIDERLVKIQDLKRTFAGEVSETGLDLSPEQLDFLLSTVVGDTVIDIHIAFYNVKMVTSQLEKLTAESLENIELARRYYGMYTVLLELMDHVYEAALEDIDLEYLPEIQGILGRSASLMRETKALMAAATPSHKSALQANAAAQELTLNAAGIYRDYLEDQRKGLREARMRLKKDLAVARNTFETVKLSGDLLTVMRSSEQLFELLYELQVPELRPFENVEMQREFDRLTDQLRIKERG